MLALSWSCGSEAQSPAHEADDTSAADATTVSAPIRAVTLDARHPPAPALLDSLRDLGATHIALVTFGFQEGVDATDIRMHTDGGWYSESDDGIRALAREARAREMDLILKPHIWVGDYDTEGQSRQDIAFDAEADWQAWTRRYRQFLLHYARLAEDVDADLLVVGTELSGVVRERPAFWRELIREIRSVYGGQLTYAANWYEEYQDVPFWDQLDFVGVQAYFPLTDADNPSLETLRSAWTSHRAALQRMHQQTNRPILFTELGYRSVGDAAATPWRWPERREQAEPAPQLQARLYRAAFEALMPQPWFAGAILWKWHPSGAADRPLGFTPQNKPAEQVIRQWFTSDALEQP